MLNLENAPKRGTIYATFVDKMIYTSYSSLEEVESYAKEENLLELHLFDKEVELRFIKTGNGDIKRFEIRDSEIYEDSYVESIYVLGADIDKTDNLKNKVDVVNYITYDENDLLHIVNYRLKEAE